MAKRVYKTAKGKPLDMEALRIANEKTIAGGNMSVNAKGDIIQNGKVIKTAKERVASSYEGTTQVAQVSLKKPLSEQDTKAEPPVKSPLPEMDDTEMTTETIRTRDDGSRYAEVMTPEGDIEIKELDKPKQKKKKTKKKAKAKPKKPTV